MQFLCLWLWKMGPLVWILVTSVEELGWKHLRDIWLGFEHPENIFGVFVLHILSKMDNWQFWMKELYHLATNVMPIKTECRRKVTFLMIDLTVYIYASISQISIYHTCQVNSAFRSLWFVNSEVISKYYSPSSSWHERFKSSNRLSHIK